MRRGLPNRPTPRTILGANCVFWVKMNRFTTATGVDRILELAKGSAQDPVQATTSRQPLTFGISATTGRYYTKGDTTDDYLLGTLSTGITTGSRPWLWCVYRSTSATVSIPVACNLASSGQNIMYLVNNTPNFSCGLVSTEGSAGEGITGPVRDGNLHLHEVGFISGPTARYVVDGTAFNGVNSGGCFRDSDRVFVGAFTAGGAAVNFSDAEISEIVLSDVLPNATQTATMRDYFRRSYGLTIA